MAGNSRSIAMPTSRLSSTDLGNALCKKQKTKRSTIQYAISNHSTL